MTFQLVFICMVKVSGISVSMPRIASRQKDRANAPFTSTEVYFKQSIIILFLEQLISELTTRFSEHTKKASLVEHLLPLKKKPVHRLGISVMQ